MSVHATRLESLFQLVREDGSCLQIRENAAEKLGEAAACSPDVCASILQQLRPLIVDKNWDVRVAASKCLDVVGRSLRIEDENIAETFAFVSLGSHQSCYNALSLKMVDINKVVKEGAPLLRSGGEEYYYKTNLTDPERRVHAAKQRRLLLKRLSGSERPIWDTQEDLLTKQLLPRLNRDHAQEIANDIEASEVMADMEEYLAENASRKPAIDLLPLSIRRKRHSNADKSSAKRLKSNQDYPNKVNMQPEGGSMFEGWASDFNHSSKATIVASLVSDLFDSMFDSKWEVRHGALLSLRQILLSAHFTAAVEIFCISAEKPSKRDLIDTWLEECLIRCICVLALDQFVDFSADGSVSPVREVCAQVFGILLGNLSSKAKLVRYLHVVRILFQGSMWQACHGGLLGLKYLVQAHKRHAPALLPFFFHDILMTFSLPNTVEDVVVLAADMLKNFVTFMENVRCEDLKNAAQLLWKSLRLYESADLAITSIVQALEAWYNHSGVAKILQSSNEVQTASWSNIFLTIPKVHHYSPQVRASSAKCVAAIFSNGDLASSSKFVNFSTVFLPHLLLQLFSDKNEYVQESLLIAWRQVVSSLSKKELLLPVIGKQLPKWMALMWSPDEIDCLDVRVEDIDNGLSRYEERYCTDQNLPKDLFLCVKFAEAIGYAAAYVPLSSSCMTRLVDKIRGNFFSSSGGRQCAALVVLTKWSYYENHLNAEHRHDQSRLEHLQNVIGPLLTTFADNHWKRAQSDTACEGGLFYLEQLCFLKRVKQMEGRIIEIFSSKDILIKPMERSKSLLIADISRQTAEHVASFPYGKLRDYPEAFKMAHFKRQDLFMVDENVQQSFFRFYHRIQGLGSSLYCELLPNPKQSGFLIKALMNSIKKEEEIAFRTILAQTIAKFVAGRVHTQKKCVAKIITNLCNNASAMVGVSYDCVDATGGGKLFRNNCSTSFSPEVTKETEIRVAGTKAALQEICNRFGGNVFIMCPALDDAISKAWKQRNIDESTIQRCMHLIMVVAPFVSSGAMKTCLSWLHPLAQLIKQPYQDLYTRCAVAHGVATICKSAEGQHREDAMFIVYTTIFATFSVTESVISSDSLEGAVVVLECIVHTLDSDIIPYVPSLVHYAMKTMSSQFTLIRTCAAKILADLVPLIPLQMDLKLRDLDLQLSCLNTIVMENAVSRTFLQGLMVGKAIQHIDVRSLLTPETSLRLYQQHGVDWLCFLANNNLHGILADDMGLGKTIQVLSAMAATLAAVTEGNPVNPCMIVCPPIIVHHWMQEVKNHLSGVFASIVDYSVPAIDRKKINCQKGFLKSRLGPTLIITTYTILRAEIKFLSSIDYMYVVLDEAHLVRNPATELFRAVLKLRTSHRVALSGTPLQNNVTDLWALFEFLMPGYLGDFGMFRREFALPIAKSKERNSTTVQKEQAAIAITRLHQKVLPFILRRTKDQVLNELPPKIISNVLLSMSPLQNRLYSLTSSVENDMTKSVKFSESMLQKAKVPTNVLANLQLLRKVCVHPALVADQSVTHGLSSKEKEVLWDWKSSGKMVGLHDLLVECCDIATQSQNCYQTPIFNSGDTSSSTHRCLVFAQLQKTLDLTEQMLQNALPRVTYRRLDGQISLAKRAGIVQQFNVDSSISILLLTTSLGGLGLTLTGADTVIFLEHSWNPFIDKQAMDRAHRIGQTRTVRVFRLIMKDTLEEYIVDLQEYKEKVAATVVQKNDAQSGMHTNTKGMLDLLRTSSATLSANDFCGENDKQVAESLPQGARELLDQIGELWDEAQYKSLAYPETII
ncbi:putative DNA helicase, ATP-dependent, RecQ type, P-loop containing nucleoside triphosphate hydrolase [Plasmopara halstedii]